MEREREREKGKELGELIAVYRGLSRLTVVYCGLLQLIAACYSLLRLIAAYRGLLRLLQFIAAYCAPGERGAERALCSGRIAAKPRLKRHRKRALSNNGRRA